MDFLVVLKSLRMIDEGFQVIARPPEALDMSTAMELLFSRGVIINTEDYHYWILFLESEVWWVFLGEFSCGALCAF
jgi:hypothetical protein